MQLISCFQIFHEKGSSSSSLSSSSLESVDEPSKRFNRLLHATLARHWKFFRTEKNQPRMRGRSISDVGLNILSLADSQLDSQDTKTERRHSLQLNSLSSDSYYDPSTGGSGSAGVLEEQSDGSDVDRPRRAGPHLRVPTPAYPSQSTGNFSSGAAAGGCGAPRSAPATPLQLDIHPRQSKHDKNAVKQLSNSVPSVRTSTLSAGSGAGAASDASEGKAPSKSRQKKFLRHFPQVGPDERVLNYYSCALVGDILLQGHLYITKNYFAFYSNVFGYVTKLLIPTASVIRVTKEKMARIIPNAVGVCTRDERHVFGSLLSRDSTYKLMTHVWKAAGVPEILPPPPAQDLRISEADLDVSEYSPEDESSSGGAESVAPPAKRRESESIISAAGGAAVIQPALLTGTVTGPVSGGVTVDVTGGVAALTDGKPLRVLLALALIILTMSATVMGYRLYQLHMYPQEELLSVSGSQVLSELVRWRGKLHARAANELHAFLTTNLLLLSKVRQSLETLSSVILTDMNQHSSRSDVPPDHTTYS